MKRSIWQRTRTAARSSRQRTGMITFPQIVIDGETIGGLDELVAADRQGQLKTLRAA